MENNLIQRAAINTFFRNLNSKQCVLLSDSVQLKSIERELYRLNRRNGNEKIKFSGIEKVLQSGLIFYFMGIRYVAELDSEKKLEGGAVKKMSRIVDKKTTSPKTSRGTVYRRNSTVIERRRRPSNWATGSTARFEAIKRTSVRLYSYDSWKQKRKETQNQEREISSLVINEKRSKRQLKRAINIEWAKRVAEDSTEKSINTFIQILDRVTESKGISNVVEMKRRIRNCLQKNIPIPIVFIWGPPYANQSQDDNFNSNQPEAAMSRWIEEILKEISLSGAQIRPITLYADTYGIVVNRMLSESVQEYGKNVQNRFADVSEFINWSDVILQNANRYNEIKKDIQSKGVCVNNEDITHAIKIQQQLDRNVTMQIARELAYSYKVERLTEAQLLFEGFNFNGQQIDNIIKFGTAASRTRNDEPYERDLPRFYIKNMPRAAWSKLRLKI